MGPLAVQKGITKRSLRPSSLPTALTTRSASNWSRQRRWPRWLEERSAEDWNRFQERLYAIQKQFEDNSYEALFGRSNDMLRGVLRNSPSTPKRSDKSTFSDKHSSFDSSNHNTSSEDVTNVGNSSSSDKRQQSSTLSKASVAETTSTTSTSHAPTSTKPSKLALKYDPVSGRMAPQEPSPDASRTSEVNNDSSVDALVKHFFPLNDANRDKSSVNTDATDTSSQGRFGSLESALKAFEDKQKSKPRNFSEAPSHAYYDPLDDALKPFDKKQKAETTTKSKDWLLQEGFVNKPSTASYDRLANQEQDELQRSLAEYDTYLKKQPQEATSTVRKPNLPADDIDLMTTADVRARMGIRKTPPKESMKEKKEIRAKLEEAFKRTQQTLENLYAREKPTKETESKNQEKMETALDRYTRAHVPDDGYSREPMGLQTSFQREKAAGRDLAEDINSRTDPKQHVVDDGYSREPMGLETSYEREKASGYDLAEDIKSRTDPKQHLVDDGYSREPMGLETSYLREKAAGYNLAEDIKSRTDPKQYVVDDGYSRKPMGLETSFEREKASGRSLADDIQAKEDPKQCNFEDGCSHEPMGLQTSYAREVRECKEGHRPTLEQELQQKTVTPLVTAEPKPVAQRPEQEPSTIRTDQCGYSLAPKGLETSYEREVAACKNGERKSLEQELQEQSSQISVAGSTCWNHEHSFKPMGLETSYQREVEACKKGGRPSLEQELVSAQDVMNNIVQKVDKAVTTKLEEARQKRLHDIALVKEVREIYEKYYGVIDTKHRQVKDQPSPVTANPANEGRVDEDVHNCLSTYDRNNPNSYSFTKDGLEAELAAQNQASSTISTAPSAEQQDTLSPETKQSTSPLPEANEAAPTASTPEAEAEGILRTQDSDATPRIYKLLAFDRNTDLLTTSQTSSTVDSPSERPIPLSVALSKLSEPAKFVPKLAALSKEGYEPVASTANLLVLRLKDAKSDAAGAATPRANPVDGTTIPLPPTPTMSPTGYVNLEPVIEKPAARDAKRVRRTEDVFSGGKKTEKQGRKHGVATVMQTLIWASAMCYVAGVVGELMK